MSLPICSTTILKALEESATHGFPVPSDIATLKHLSASDKHRVLGILLSTVSTNDEAKSLLATYRDEGLQAALVAYTERRKHTALLKERAKEYAAILQGEVNDTRFKQV